MSILVQGCVFFVGGVLVAPLCPPAAPLLLLAAALTCAALRQWWGVGLLSGWMAVALVPPGPQLAGDVVVVGAVVGAATGRSADLEVARWAEAGGPWIEARGRVRARFRDRPPPPGAAVVVQARAEELFGRALPGAPDPVFAARRVGVRTQLRVRRVRVLGGDPVQRDWPEGSGVLKAIATGDRGDVDPEVTALLRRTGTSHLLAISGFHVGSVALAVGGLTTVLLRALAVFRPVGVSTLPAWGAAVAAAALYTLAAGAPVSAQRALGLVAMGAVARATGRIVQPTELLGVVAVVVLVFDPGAIATPSFQLSFGALVGLIRVTPLLERLAPPDLPLGGAWLVRSVAATIGATVGTLPAAAWWFQSLAPWSIPANLVAIPLTSFGIVPAALVAAFGPPGWTEMAVWVGNQFVGVLVLLLEPLAVPPLAPAVGALGALLLGTILLAPERPVWIVAVLTIALGLRPVPTVLTVTFLDVGQGDATLVEWPDGRRWLVDGGPPGRSVLAWLRRRGIRRLDVVVATHAQDDHVGGLVPVLESLRVGQLWLPELEGELGPLAQSRGTAVIVRPPPALHPPPEFVATDPNDRSIVLSAGPVLLTGDIERHAESVVADVVQPHAVLKVPHHGSTTSSSLALLDAVRPSIAVVSAGRGNPFGHPRGPVLLRYAARGAHVLRTDVHGTIELTFTDSVQIRTHRPGQGWTTW